MMILDIANDDSYYLCLQYILIPIGIMFWLNEQFLTALLYKTKIKSREQLKSRTYIVKYQMSRSGIEGCIGEGDETNRKLVAASRKYREANIRAQNMELSVS